MSTKPTTIAAAEKKVIKSEISTLKRALRKINSDTAKEHKRIATVRRQLDRDAARLTRAHTSETAAATRRIAILQGRL